MLTVKHYVIICTISYIEEMATTPLFFTYESASDTYAPTELTIIAWLSKTATIIFFLQFC